MIQSFPKIFHLGDNFIVDIFDGPVEITEKVDGSQFVFGNIGGQLFTRSKGKIHIPEAIDKMFVTAVDYVRELHADRLLPEGRVYYCEYLQRPKHNVLTYNRVPVNNLALFGVLDDGHWIDQHYGLSAFAADIEIEVVSLLGEGEGWTAGKAIELIETESFLGGPNVEGIVVKNYTKALMIGDRVFSLKAGKFVSEKFKEKHKKNWQAEYTGKGRWEVYCSQYATPARWQKAVQHLRDNGTLECNPRDIGPLINEVKRDISEEEKHNIMNVLWKEFGGDLLRRSVMGLPEWYKSRLAKGEIE